MTRKYDTVEIDGVMYEKHGVKVDKKSIGSVPVRRFADDLEVDADSRYHEFTNFVDSASIGKLVQIIEDYKYGLAVRLQGKARNTVTGDSFTDADMAAIADSLDQDVFVSFHGNMDGLREHCLEVHKAAIAEGGDTYGENYLWKELLK